MARSSGFGRSVSQPGGTGIVFDWKQARGRRGGIEETSEVVIAGGWLTPRNVGEAIEILQPWGVDVASGVEARPGKKDPEKVRAFVRAVRDMDRKVELGMATVPRTTKVKIPTLAAKDAARMGHPRVSS